MVQRALVVRQNHREQNWTPAGARAGIARAIHLSASSISTEAAAGFFMSGGDRSDQTDTDTYAETSCMVQVIFEFYP
jgi:hypothetical protein